MNISELKKELGLYDKEIAEFYGLKNIHTYRNSSAKQRYEDALCKFYSFLREGEKK